MSHASMHDSVDDSVVQERLRKLGSLQQQLHALKKKHGGTENVPIAAYQDVFRRMVELVAGVTPCPEHGLLEDVTARLTPEEDGEGFELELDGVCCDRLRSDVEGKLQELAV